MNGTEDGMTFSNWEAEMWINQNINANNESRRTGYPKVHGNYCKNYTVLHYGLSTEHTLIVPESRRMRLTNWRWWWARPTEMPLREWWPPFSSFLGTEIGDGMCFFLYYNYHNISKRLSIRSNVRVGTYPYLGMYLGRCTMGLEIEIGVGTGL